MDKTKKSLGFLLVMALLISGCGKSASVDVASNRTGTDEVENKSLDLEVQVMFSNTWTDGYIKPKLTLDFFNRGLKVQEYGFDERWIRINWKDPDDVHRWLKLHDDETLIFNDEHSEVTLKPWKYWRKINGLDK